MAAVTICSDFGAQKDKVDDTLCPLSRWHWHFIVDVNFVILKINL